MKSHMRSQNYVCIVTTIIHIQIEVYTYDRIMYTLTPPLFIFR